MIQSKRRVLCDKNSKNFFGWVQVIGIAVYRWDSVPIQDKLKRFIKPDKCTLLRYQ